MLKRLSAVLLVMAMVAVACGDSGSSETTAASTTQGGGQTGEGILAQVQSRGVLHCGVSGAAVAFSEQQPDGSMTGFDADFCRALAAAVLGDANAVEFTALTAAERFTAVQTGAVDVLFRNTTWTQSRDTEVGMDFGPTTYYDGQQVMAREGDGFSGSSTLNDLEGAVVCTNAGTTTEKNISEATAALGVNITLNTFEDFNQVMDQFLAGACDAVTTDGSGLVGNKATRQPEGENWVIFPGTPISKEPLGPTYGQNDSQWADVINWVVYASLIFYENGVTADNAAAMQADPPTGEIGRLLGGEGELQTKMGLDANAFFNMVSQMGNYAEIFNRNLNPVGLSLEGSLNDLWSNGGLMYPPPAR